MAKKRLSDVPSAKSVKQFLALRKFDQAAAEARMLVGFAPGAATSELLRECLFALAEFCVERKQYADFNRVAQELEPLCLAAGAEAIRSFAQLLLRGLQPGEVNRLIGAMADAEIANSLRNDLADYFVRARHSTGLPEDWKPAHAALQTALQLYDAKKDDASRDALNAIGLGSPFLEWKVWLRGLLAWGAEDTVRALENWSRLNPTRLPYRLAAPMRAAADPTWLAEQPPLREQLRRQYLRLSSQGLAGQLQQLRPELGGRKGLAKALKLAEALLPAFKTNHPKLVPHLMNVYYCAMLKRAEPDDLDKFTRAFGRMPDDPSFYKLSAQIFDGVGEVEQSMKMWGAYIDWLRGSAKWPPSLKQQAIASLYRTLARLAGDLDELDELDPEDDEFFFVPRKQSAKAKAAKAPKAPPPKPSSFLQLALDAAPFWEQAADDLMKAYDEEGDAVAAVAFAERYLQAVPGAAGVRLAYVEVLMLRGDYAAALVELAPLRKSSAFDADVRVKVVDCVFYCIYHFARGSDWKSAEVLLNEENEMLTTESTVVTRHLKYALYKKLKRVADADVELQTLDGANVVHAFLFLANAQIFKAKPAEKSAAGQAYKAALATEMIAAEAIALFHCYKFYQGGGIEFTGLKAMHKGIVDAMLATPADATLTEDQAVELFTELGPLTTMPKFEKFSAALAKRFPKHPLFALGIVELWAAKHPSGRAPYKIINLLRKARELVRNSTDPKYKILEDRIDELHEQLDPFSSLRNMFDSFF